MAKKRGPRLKKGLPRGGLGLIGFVPALLSLGLALFVRADVAALVCVLLVGACVWCALGLRKDDASGEVADGYVDEESFSFRELLAGNWEHPLRRRSNGILACGALGLGIALCRLLFGWGPLA
jgi:hypothetical protein